MFFIVDLDGTLTDCRHRQHHVEAGEWDLFYSKMGEDKPNAAILGIVNHMIDEYHIPIFCTGRPKKYENQTLAWLNQYLPGMPIAIDMVLYMREDDDFRPDYVVKKEMLAAMRTQGMLPDLAIEDRQNVVEMWRAEGIQVLQFLYPTNQHE